MYKVAIKNYRQGREKGETWREKKRNNVRVIFFLSLACSFSGPKYSE